jgi:hypothetical protein
MAILTDATSNRVRKLLSTERIEALTGLAERYLFDRAYIGKVVDNTPPGKQGNDVSYTEYQQNALDNRVSNQLSSKQSKIDCYNTNNSSNSTIEHTKVLFRQIHFYSFLRRITGKDKSNINDLSIVENFWCLMKKSTTLWMDK